MTYKLLYKNDGFTFATSSDEITASPPSGKTWVISKIFICKLDTDFFSYDQKLDGLTFTLSPAGGAFSAAPTYYAYAINPHDAYSGTAIDGSAELGEGMIIHNGESLSIKKHVSGMSTVEYSVFIFGDEKTA